MCKGSLEQLHLFSNMEILGNYYRLSNELLKYKEGIEVEVNLTEDDKEYIVSNLLWTIADSINECTEEPTNSFSYYIDELIKFIEYLLPEFECPYSELLLGADLFYREFPFKDLLSNEGISVKDKEQILSNFIHMKDLRSNDYLLKFYKNLIDKDVLLPITKWEDLKALLLNLNPVDAEYICDYVNELHNIALEDYQVEFLLELGYAPKNLISRAYKNGLRIPEELKYKLYSLELKEVISHINNTEELIKEWNGLTKEQRDYVLKVLREEENSYIQLGVLPLIISSVDAQLINQGITDFDIYCKDSY